MKCPIHTISLPFGPLVSQMHPEARSRMLTDAGHKDQPCWAQSKTKIENGRCCMEVLNHSLCCTRESNTTFYVN